MKAIDKAGLIQFKHDAMKGHYFKEKEGDREEIAEIKETINGVILWLCELEEEIEPC